MSILAKRPIQSRQAARPTEDDSSDLGSRGNRVITNRRSYDATYAFPTFARELGNLVPTEGVQLAAILFT
jgi:hypothetical protein